MSDIQQRMDDAGEAISQETEEIVDMINALTHRISIVEHQLQVVTQQNVNIEKELNYWRSQKNPIHPTQQKSCPNIGTDNTMAAHRIKRIGSNYKPSHPQITLGGYNAKSSQA